MKLLSTWIFVNTILSVTLRPQTKFPHAQKPQVSYKKLCVILTLRNVGPSHSGADPPESDLEGDAGGGVTVGEAHGLASEQPHVANEGR